MSDNGLQGAIRRLAAGDSLSAEDVTSAFDVIMRGDGTPAQVAALLMALRVKGETPDEVAGVARSLRAAMIPLVAPNPEQLVDTCGTGGGAVQTFNISTAAALVAAGAGVRVAKHGNRSFTSRSGSADVLEALAVTIEVPPAAMARTLAAAGIVFMYAPVMHPAMRHVGPIRRELGIPTVMNIVGPLANPAHAGRQVVGVAERHRVPLIAGALRLLGTQHALIVHGEPGLDEVSPLGLTHVVEIRDGASREWCVDPRDFGIADVKAEDLAGGSPSDNAARIHEVLRGGGPPGARAAVQLNAAAAVYVSGRVKTMQDAFAMVTAALDAGRGEDALNKLRLHSTA